jgi:ankyrin repeat protein
MAENGHDIINLEKYFYDMATYSESLNGRGLIHHLASSDGPVKSFKAFLAKYTTPASIDQRDRDGNTALMLAVCEGFEDNVRALVDAGANVGLANNCGVTPLSHACTGSKKFLDILLKSPTAIIALAVVGDDGNTPLLNSITSLRVSLTRKLLDAKADPNQVGAAKKTPLGALIGAYSSRSQKDTKVTLLKALLSAGASISDCNKDGESYLHLAATGSHISGEFIKVLIDAEANPWVPDADGESAFEAAVAVPTTPDDVLVAMLEAPALGAIRGVNQCVGFFNTAVTAGREKVAVAMLEAGLDVQRAGPDNAASPLEHMCMSGEPAMVARLLEHVKCRWDLGKYSLDLVEEGNVEMLRVLKNAGVSLLQRYNRTGKNALMLACQKQQYTLDIATVLLDAGVSVNTRNNQRRTALFYAVESGNPALVQLLLDRGAKAMAEDKDGMTVLLLDPSAEVVELLLQHITKKMLAKEAKAATTAAAAAAATADAQGYCDEEDAPEESVEEEAVRDVSIAGAAGSEGADEDTEGGASDDDSM